jgi:molecular chaperone DnaK (HSP70)
LSYGIFRRNEFSNKPINVCFVDVGHCKTSVFVAAFTKEELKLLNQLHDRNLGTRDLDWATMEHYAEIVKKNTGTDILTREKSRLRILDALEKQRKILSANSEATLNVDFIVEDYDLNHTLKREEYETINAKFFDKFREQLTQLRNGTYCRV